MANICNITCWVVYLQSDHCGQRQQGHRGHGLCGRRAPGQLREGGQDGDYHYQYTSPWICYLELVCALQMCIRLGLIFGFSIPTRKRTIPILDFWLVFDLCSVFGLGFGSLKLSSLWSMLLSGGDGLWVHSLQGRHTNISGWSFFQKINKKTRTKSSKSD